MDRGVTGLDTSPQTARKIEEYLKKRGYTTALSVPAFKAMHDSASTQWDSAESLRVDYTNLVRCPDPSYMRLLVEKLQTCESTPESIQFADLLADESRFDYLRREARITVGDLFARFGRRDKATRWYRSADVPDLRIAEMLSERTMFAD